MAREDAFVRRTTGGGGEDRGVHEPMLLEDVPAEHLQAAPARELVQPEHVELIPSVGESQALHNLHTKCKVRRITTSMGSCLMRQRRRGRCTSASFSKVGSTAGTGWTLPAVAEPSVFFRFGGDGTESRLFRNSRFTYHAGTSCTGGGME